MSTDCVAPMQSADDFQHPWISAADPCANDEEAACMMQKQFDQLQTTSSESSTPSQTASPAPSQPMSPLPALYKGVGTPQSCAVTTATNSPVMKPCPSNKIFVGGLPKTADEGTIATYFGNFGVCLYVDLRKDPEGVSRGFAFVTFQNEEAVTAVLNHNQHKIADKLVEVNPFAEKKGGNGECPLPPVSTGIPAASGSPVYGKAPKRKARGKSFTPMGEIQEHKVFVGGLPKAMPTCQIREYFEQFGDIVEVDIKTEPGTTQSRGFGFISFLRKESATAVLDNYESHQVGGKWVEVKAAVLASKSDRKAAAKGKTMPPPPPPPPASPSDGGKSPSSESESIYEPSKIFVGGLPSSATDESIRKCFEGYGTVVEIALKRDDSGKPRGFGFVSFSNDDEAQVALANYEHNKVDGKWVEVKAAEKQSVIMQRNAQAKAKARLNGLLSGNAKPMPPLGTHPSLINRQHQQQVNQAWIAPQQQQLIVQPGVNMGHMYQCVTPLSPDAMTPAGMTPVMTPAMTPASLSPQTFTMTPDMTPQVMMPAVHADMGFMQQPLMAPFHTAADGSTYQYVPVDQFGVTIDPFAVPVESQCFPLMDNGFGGLVPQAPMNHFAPY